MRIIGGDLGGRVIKVPKNNWKTRPTTDRTREALFNILTHQLDFNQINGLDLFGGTGMISFECISRGAHQMTYVEKYAPIVRFVKKVAIDLNIDHRMNCINSDVFKFLKQNNEKYNFIFADPPYQLESFKDLLPAIQTSQIAQKKCLIVFEHDQHFDALDFDDTRKYGGSFLSFKWLIS